MYKNLKIKNKLALLLAIPLLALIFLILITVYNMHAITEDNSEIYDGTKYGLKADKDLYQSYIELHNLCVFEYENEEYEEILKEFEENISSVKERVEIVKEISDKYKDDILQYVNEDSKQTIYYEIEQFQAAIDNWENNSKLLLETKVKVRNEENRESILNSLKERDKEFKETRKHLKYLRNVFEDFSEDVIEEQHKMKRSLIMYIIVVSAIAVAVVLILGWLFIRDITNSMRRTVKVMDKIAENDLRVEEIKINSKDEIAQLSHAANSMSENLKNLIKEIYNSVEQFTSSSKQLKTQAEQNVAFIEGVTNAADELSKGALDQAQNVEESSMKLDALADQINVVVKNSDSMKYYADMTSKATKDGMNSISELNNIVKTNTDISRKVDYQISELEKKSSSVNQITDVIQAISKQTNLLALNASIEAAAAGEAGKGFSVVANEIRSLSQQTSASTNKIEEIINEIENEITKTKAEINQLSLIIQKTNKVSVQTAKSFETIDLTVKDTNLKIDELIQNISSIHENKDDVVDAIQGIADITEKSVLATEEVSASIDDQHAAVGQIDLVAQQLQQVAVILEELISNFKF